MKYNDINKQFSEWVNNYLSDGWIINSKSMGGSQGEIAKVDFVKGDELVRIWINRESAHWDNWRDPKLWHGNMVVIRIGRWMEPAYHSTKHGFTVWMSSMEIIGEVTYYEIEHDWYTPYEWEAVESQNKRHDRYVNNSSSYSEDITSEKTKDIATKYLKNHEGYQRVSRSKIHVRKNISGDRNHAAYYVVYNDHSYLLH